MSALYGGVGSPAPPCGRPACRQLLRAWACAGGRYRGRYVMASDGTGRSQ